MKRSLAVLMLFLISAPVHAKSYLCRADGSVDEYENGTALQVIKPLRQNEIEEMPLPAKIEPAAEPAVQEKPQPKKRSTFVPLTMKDIEERSGAY